LAVDIERQIRSIIEYNLIFAIAPCDARSFVYATFVIRQLPVLSAMGRETAGFRKRNQGAADRAD
jgi:hypothetical protein